MRLSEIYIKEIVLGEFWKGLEKDLIVNEGDSGLKDLIAQANELIFQKFKIDPNSKDYVIVGSSRLYLYPELRDAFNLEGTIGDLDIVIPDRQLWVDAGLEEAWNKGGIYRPTDDGSIEVFNVWDPSKAGGEYADVSVRSTQEVMNDSTNINGYNFMSMFDIMDYKTSLHRDKEKDVVDLINQYQSSGSSNKTNFLRKIVKLIGLGPAKEFLGTVGK